MKHSFATLDQLRVSLFLDQKFSICFWYLKFILYDFITYWVSIQTYWE